MAAGTDKRRALTTSLIWLVVAAFLIITVVGQAQVFLSDPYKTETATLYTTTQSLNFKGVYVRNEEIQYYSGIGTVSYTHTDGSKVAKNAEIAKVYRNRSDISVIRQIEELQSIREILSDAQSLAGTDSSQLESFSNQISEKHSSLIQQLYNGNFDEASKMKGDMLGLYSKRSIVKGDEENYDDKIAEIDRRIASLYSTVASEPDPVTIEKTGYFISSVDGYESILNTQTMYDLTADDIDRITNSEISGDNPSGTIGKLISDYTWYLVAVLDSVKLGTVFEGAHVTLRIGSSQQNVESDIVKLKKQDDGRSVAIFKCDMFLADFIGSRVTQAKILMDNYTGIRIPNEALRVENDNIGVYIRDGIVVRFRKIKQIITEESFTIAENTSKEEGYLSLYDNIIVEGRDLHDGKIIQ